MLHRSVFAGLAAVLAASACLAAGPAVQAHDAWARATAPGAGTGGVYLSITNAGKTDDRLLGAATDRAQAVELHTHRMQGNVAQMIMLPEVKLSAGKRTDFAPGGLHVMLIGLAQPLAVGERFPLTLRFAKGGTQKVEVVVRAIGDEPAGAHHGH